MEHEKLIAYYAWKAVRQCPSLDFADVKQELSISMIEARIKYDPNTDLEFVNYLGKRLSWAVGHIVRDHIRHLKAENKWAYVQKKTIRASEISYDSLCLQVISILDGKMKHQRRRRFNQAKSLFQLLAYPESASGNRDQSKPKSFNVASIARYLGISQMAKPFDEVKKAVWKVING